MNRWTTLAIGALFPIAAFAQTAAQTEPTFDAHVLTRAEFADALVRHGFKVAGALGAQNYEAAGGTLTRIAPRSSAAASAQR